MRLLLSVRQLVSRIRVAASPPEPAQVAKKRRRSSRKPKGHVAPSPPVRPALAPQAPAFMQLEQGVLERFRAQMCQALQDRLDALTAAERQASKPICCGKPMSYHDRRSVPCQAWMGSIRVMGSGRQGHSLAGGSPAVPIARLRHVAMPQLTGATPGSLRGVNGPAALREGSAAVGAIGGPSKRGSLNITE